jgi:hypothetical protein
MYFEFIANVDKLFRVRFDRLTPREKQYLRALADMGLQSNFRKEALQRADDIRAISARQLFNESGVWRLRCSLERATRVDNILGAAGENFHGDDVFETDKLQRLPVERHLEGPREPLRVKSAYTDQQVHTVFKLIL